MKFKVILAVFSLLLSCQGPWSYYPENPENYRGIWITAYLVSGRPVKNVCLEKIHNLNEVYMRGFAFYEQASIEIKGSFNGRDTSIFLRPDTAYYAHNPNCFVGDEDLMADADANYEMYVSVVWDSVGKKTTSEFSAKTHIPKKFKIKRAYDLLGERFGEYEVIQYLLPEEDKKFNYLYFIPEYSNEDIGGVLVSMVYEDLDWFWWGENFMDEIAESLTPGNDTALHAQFGDRQLLYTATNTQIANTNKDIDSIPVLGLMLPAYGNIKLLFYATTREYIDYQNTFLQNYGDSRVKPIYNIMGGAGIFAGMLVDTFEVTLRTSRDVGIYSYFDAQDAYCRTYEFGTDKSRYETRRQCIEIWDKIIWCEISNGKPEYSHVTCNYDGYTYPWYDIPSSGLKRVLSMEDIVTWCGFRDFPIKQYPPCGSAMVHFFKSGKKSPILEREVKKWCKEHKNDVECLSLMIE
ncbi:MAG: hypothetical protein LBC75_10255 [Fibromonadaceae bacterium]|jgi:hypothetical protein|nr:hypothetical protein [Fibromonadaceae bacterium]